MKIGTLEITKGYVGNTDVNKIYVGTTVVFNGGGGTYNFTSVYPYGTVQENQISDKENLLACTISPSVTRIDDGAFSDCYQLTGITIPASVTEVGTSGFSNCTSLVEVNFESTGDTSIRGYAFSNTAIYNISVSGYYMRDYAFRNCNNLSSVTIYGYNSITQYAFYDCPNLTAVDGVRYADIIAVKAENTDGSTYIVRDGTRQIGAACFSGCSNASVISVPNTVTSIGTNAFRGCASLESVNIPEGVTNLRANTYSGCTSLTAVTLPSTLVETDHSIFRACNNLEVVDIPVSLTTIGNYAFYCATSTVGLREINYSGTQAQWKAISFGTYWKRSARSVTVHCTDGDITV